MDEEKIKKAFTKIKEDILNLQSQIEELKRTIQSSTIRQKNPTDNRHTTHSSTDNPPLEAPKDPYNTISTGNEGVSTDRQTDRQTDTSTGNKGVEVRFNQVVPQTQSTETKEEQNKIDQLQKVSEVIESLDDIKKDLRLKIKHLTNQELSVLTTIYQLEEKGLIVDYSLLAQHLEITESSIRDYIQRLIKKGFPVDKIKENNKKIIIKISQDLRKIAPLSTIMQLREL